MLQKIVHFIKYNNAAVIILAVILILGGGALAAGPETIGEKQTRIEGVDNAALLAADLANFSMDFKIERIEADEKYYYATYSYLDLALADSAWQYQLNQRTQKISKKIKEDPGAYLAKFLAKHYQARTRELKREKALAEAQGPEKRVEVIEYSGLIGRTLDLAAKVFPGYEPAVKRELPAPENFNLPVIADSDAVPPASAADDLTRAYNDYMADHPDLFNPLDDSSGDSSGDTASSTPEDNLPPDQIETTDSTLPDDGQTPDTTLDSASGEPAADEPASVEIIDLPVSEPEPAPAE